MQPYFCLVDYQLLKIDNTNKSWWFSFIPTAQPSIPKQHEHGKCDCWLLEQKEKRLS